MKKKVWGNATWLVFHTLAEKLKPEHTSEIASLFSIIVTICSNLPCPECLQHAKLAMQRVNKERITASKENLIEFLWMFHNTVNKRTKLPEFPRESLEIYKKANTRNVIIHFINIMSENSRNEKAMLDSFHRQRFIKTFKDYISANIGKYNL